MENKFKELANGKSSKDCTRDEAINVHRASIPKKEETWEERKKRINAFRCGW